MCCVFISLDVYDIYSRYRIVFNIDGLSRQRSLVGVLHFLLRNSKIPLPTEPTFRTSQSNSFGTVIFELTRQVYSKREMEMSRRNHVIAGLVQKSIN